MKIGITGCKGRMGALLVRTIQSGAFPGAVLAGGSALAAEIASHKDDFFITDNPQTLFEKSDAVIDFTVPAATITHAGIAAQTGKPLIIGTTGLSDEQQKDIERAAQKTCIVQSANYSLGVNVLAALVEKAAATLQADWDIEIFEAHHKHKIDAPSGTAKLLGNAAMKHRTGQFVTDREGARGPHDIGYAVSRGGDVVGDHSVTFYGMGERVVLSHMATDRALFARGAIHAALWSAGKPPGLKHFARDVLALG